MAGSSAATEPAPARQASPRPGWVRLWPLGGLALVVIVLAGAGVLPRWSGLVHLVALPPLGLFTDLRLLLAEPASWPAAVGWLALAAALRIGVFTWAMGRWTWANAALVARFYAVMFVPMLLAAFFITAATTVLYARFFWPALGFVAIVVLATGAVLWQGEPQGRAGMARVRQGGGGGSPSGRHGRQGDGGGSPSSMQRRRGDNGGSPSSTHRGHGDSGARAGGPNAQPHRLRGRWRLAWASGLRLEVLLPYSGVVVVLGLLAHAAPALTLPLVLVSALVTAVTIRALHRPPVRHPRRLLLVTGAAVVAFAVVLVGTRIAEDPDPQPQAREGSVLLMSGINSSSGSGAILEEDPAQMGFECEQTYYFSYAGPGDGQPQGEAQCEATTGAPYDADDTLRPVDEQVAALAAQTQDLPRPLVITAHSHAVWIVWEALARGEIEVDVLVAVGPFADSPVGYSPRGEDGQGRVLGDLLRLAAPVADWVDFNFRPDEPGPQELLAQRNVSREILGQDIGDVAVLSVTSSGDLPLMPGGWRLDADRNACPVRTAHPELPRAGAYVEEVNRFLEGEPARDCPVWRDWGTTAAIPFGAAYRG